MPLVICLHTYCSGTVCRLLLVLARRVIGRHRLVVLGRASWRRRRRLLLLAEEAIRVGHGVHLVVPLIGQLRALERGCGCHLIVGVLLRGRRIERTHGLVLARYAGRGGFGRASLTVTVQGELRLSRLRLAALRDGPQVGGAAATAARRVVVRMLIDLLVLICLRGHRQCAAILAAISLVVSEMATNYLAGRRPTAGCHCYLIMLLLMLLLMMVMMMMQMWWLLRHRSHRRGGCFVRQFSIRTV